MLNDKDFFAIEAELTSTPLGRFFLQEYLTRNRHRETKDLMGAIKQLETIAKESIDLDTADEAARTALEGKTLPSPENRTDLDTDQLHENQAARAAKPKETKPKKVKPKAAGNIADQNIKNSQKRADTKYSQADLVKEVNEIGLRITKKSESILQLVESETGLQSSDDAMHIMREHLKSIQLAIEFQHMVMAKLIPSPSEQMAHSEVMAHPMEETNFIKTDLPETTPDDVETLDLNDVETMQMDDERDVDDDQLVEAEEADMLEAAETPVDFSNHEETDSEEHILDSSNDLGGTDHDGDTEQSQQTKIPHEFRIDEELPVDESEHIVEDIASAGQKGHISLDINEALLDHKLSEQGQSVNDQDKNDLLLDEDLSMHFN